MILFPNAKINIGLTISGKRPDGYHNLETVFYPVRMHDVLEVIESDKLMFDTSGLSIPGDTANNLCLKAYHLLARDFKLPPLHIHLYKNIPTGAGLGGGSADASFFIRLMDMKFELGMSMDQMEGYARQLGADCSFFIRNKPVFAKGRGDEFEEIDLRLTDYYLVLIMPELHISTREAFGGVIPRQSGSSLRELIKMPPEDWVHSVKNDFEQVLFDKYPLLAKIKQDLYDAGALYASMSGSGSSVYGIFKERVELPQPEGQRIFYTSLA